MNLSARSYHKVIKVARTIADLEGVENISTNHITEALQFRPSDSELKISVRCEFISPVGCDCDITIPPQGPRDLFKL